MRARHRKVRKFEHDEEDAGRNGELGVKLLRGGCRVTEGLPLTGWCMAVNCRLVVKVAMKAREMKLQTELRAGCASTPATSTGRRQQELLAALREVFAAAPLFTPRMPKSGRPFTVRMSNCGPLGWISDECGYRYQPTHPETGRPWPPIPDTLVALWNDLARYPCPPRRV